MSGKTSTSPAFGTVTGERKLFYGWIVVGTCFLCWFTADAFGWYTFGVFIGPVTEEMGWTTTAFTFALTLRLLISGLLGPIFGPLADKKHGARVLMSVGILIAGSVPLMVSRMTTLWQFYMIYGVIGALGVVGFGGLVSNAIISKWFILKRGRAIGISAMGVSISGFVFVQMTNSLIPKLGWRTTLDILGLMIWGIALIPVLIFVRRRPEDMGLLPDGRDAGSRPSDPTGLSEPYHDAGVEETWTLGEAIRTKSLWLLLMGFNITGLALSGVFIHFYPFLESRGFSTLIAGNAVSVFAICCAIVKIPWGLLAERYHVRHCITACYLGCALSLLILLNSYSLVSVFMYAVVYGVALGGDMVLRELIWANYFGRTFLGTIRGVIMPINLIAMAGGPLFAAWLRDMTGSYNLPYTIFIILIIVGTFFLFLAKPPQKSPIR
jgi:MFS family permease